MHLALSRSLRGTALLCFSLLLSSPVIAQASGQSPCTIDLSTAIADLAEAQVSASNGDQATALETITRVQQQLEEIETSCTAAALSAPELPQSYTAPEDLFTFSYPAEWFVSEFKEGRDWNMAVPPNSDPIPAGGSVILSQEPIASEAELLSTELDTGSRILISVGSPLHILESVGLYSDEIAATYIEDGLPIDALMEQLLLPFTELEEGAPDSMTEIEAERPTFFLDLRETDLPFYIVFVSLNDETQQYAVIVGTAAEDAKASLEPLIKAIADTLQVTE